MVHHVPGRVHGVPGVVPGVPGGVPGVFMVCLVCLMVSGVSDGVHGVPGVPGGVSGGRWVMDWVGQETKYMHRCLYSRLAEGQ